MPTALPLQTDDRLVARVRAGDDRAFAVLVTRYREPLLGYAARLAGGSHADAEDIVQDAFIRALAGLRASDRPMTVRPWLYAIVRNRAFDLHRSSAARRAAGDAGARHLALVPAANEADPAQRTVAREDFDRVVRELGRLPARQRDALVHRELGGASHVELADALGTTVAGIKALLVRARSSLASAVAA